MTFYEVANRVCEIVIKGIITLQCLLFLIVLVGMILKKLFELVSQGVSNARNALLAKLVCSRKGHVRDPLHKSDSCQCCTKYRFVPHQLHDFDGGCICRTCGAMNPDETVHDPGDDCVCRKCGQRMPSNSAAHDWNGCTCRKCGMNRGFYHVWDGCVCTVCGREEGHTWELYTFQNDYGENEGVYRCSRCGQER